MRLSPLIAVLLLASVAVAQTPPTAPEQSSPDKPDGKPQSDLIWQIEPVGPGSEENRLSELPPDTRLNVIVDGVPRVVTPPELKELRRQGRDLRPGPVPCHVDYSGVDAERKASDKHLREMKQRGEVIPVVHQFEQEMYYEERYRKLREKTCGKPVSMASSGFRGDGVAATAPRRAGEGLISSPPDMRKKACEALGVVCKPVKHW